MQITEINTEGLKRVLEVVVNATAVEEKLEKHLTELSPKVSIRGFRPGKAPKTIIRKQHGRSGLNTVIQPLMTKICNDVIVERKERQFSQVLYILPEKWDDNLLAGQDISVRLEYEVYPEIEPQAFSEFKIERVIYDVTEDVIDSMLRQLSGDGELFEVQADGGTAEKGDRLTVSFDFKADGKKIDRLSAEEFPIILGQAAIHNEVDNQLLGTKVGEYRNVTITLPEDFSEPAYAKKEVEIEIHVLKLEKLKEILVDDALLERFKCKDETELRSHIKSQLEKSMQYRANQSAKEDLADQLLAKHEFLVTDAMVDSELKVGWKEYEYTISNAPEQVNGTPLTEEEYGKKLRTYHEQKLRESLVLQAYAEKYDIHATEEELRNSLNAAVANHPDPSEMRKHLEDKNKLIEYYQILNSDLVVQKALDYVFEHVEVTDKKVGSSDVNVVEQGTEET